MIKTALVHASFGRPLQAVRMAQEWMEAADKPEEVEYLIGLDDNDPTIDEYKHYFTSEVMKYARVEVNVGDSRTAAIATNRLGTIMSSTTGLIIANADDMAPCPHWDTELWKRLEGFDPFVDIKFIGVSDGLRGYGIALLYMILTRAWYTKFGYFLYPEYDGMFVDNDMHMVAERLGAIINAPELLFQHRHYTLGMSPFDNTYARTNNPDNFNRNLEIYNKRASRNFDL